MSNTLNIAAINTVADAVEGLPFDVFNMGEWMDTLGGPINTVVPNWNDRVQTAVDCETAACIAGWTCIVLDDEWSPYGYDYKPDKRARKLLGMTMDEARQLFTPVVGVDVMCNYADITPKDAADTMRRYADTGRVEWLAEPKLWHDYIKASPEHWEMEILESDAYCDVAGVYHDGQQTEVNIPQDGRKLPDEVREFVSHVIETWERIA